MFYNLLLNFWLFRAFTYGHFLSFRTPFYKLLVPTVDTVRYQYLTHNLLQSLCPVMLVGPVGTGKTSVAQDVLNRLDPAKYSVLVLNMSAQVRISTILEVM